MRSIITFSLVLFWSGCGLLKQQPSTAVERTETIREFYKDTIIYRESNTVSQVIDSATIAGIAAQLKAGKDTVVYRNSNTVLKFYKNEAGQLSVDCQTEREAFTLALKEINRELATNQTKVVYAHRTPWYAYLTIVILGASVFLLILKKQL